MARTTLRLFDGFDHTSPQLRNDVKELQMLLRKNGYTTVSVDGMFNITTQKALQAYQQLKKLPVTGLVDDATWAVLLGTNTTTSSTPASTTPAASSSGFKFQTTYATQDVTLLKQLEALKAFATTVTDVATKFGLPPSVICGIGSRESAWGLALTPPGPGGTGDGGHGRGLLQVDDRWHPDFIASGKWADGRENLIYGGALLKSFMDYFVSKGGWKPGIQTLQAAVAAYNAGPRRVLEGVNAGQDVDFFTTGRNYSKDVLSRSGWFQLYGWK